MLTLDNFVGGTDVDVTIAGYGGSTQVASLLQAFETLNISVVLPGLNSSLLESGALIGESLLPLKDFCAILMMT